MAKTNKTVRKLMAGAFMDGKSLGYYGPYDEAAKLLAGIKDLITQKLDGKILDPMQIGFPEVDHFFYRVTVEFGGMKKEIEIKPFIAEIHN